MIYFNEFIGLGVITADPVCSYKENTRTEFTIALNKPGRSRAYYMDCVVWGDLAIQAYDLLTKGCKVLLNGEIETNHFKDSRGVWHKSFCLCVEKFSIVEKAKNRITASAAIQVPKPILPHSD